MASPDDSNPTYALKCVRFFGREVPIVLQNENGPCPLLAIVNVLSLRNQIRLPSKARYTDQERLIAVVANFLIEANNMETKDANDEYRANLEQNLADVMTLLPKLCTGVDVNLRFNSIRGFEFTDEIAIFDLCDISLVHGWLVDPGLEKEAADVIGSRTYNDVVQMVITALGNPGAAAVCTPTGSSKNLLTHSPAEPASQTEGAAALTAANRAVPPEASMDESETLGGGSMNGMDLEEANTLRMALAMSLGLSEASGGSAGDHVVVREDVCGDGQPKREEFEEQQQAEWEGRVDSHGVEERGSGLVEEAKREVKQQQQQEEEEAAQQEEEEEAGRLQASGSDSICGGADRSASSGAGPRGEADEESGSRAAVLSLVHGVLQRAVAKDEEEQIARQQQQQGDDVSGTGPAATSAGLSEKDEAGVAIQEPAVVDGSGGETSSGETSARPVALTPVRTPLTPEQQAQVDAANVAKGFLEISSSQLTEQGLSCLSSGLRPNELAVFFRNNHFSTLFCHKGNLYLLVTDLGYMWEQQVVWEHLCSVHGDTYFVKSDFTQFTGKEVEQKATHHEDDQAQTAVALARAAFQQGGAGATAAGTAAGAAPDAAGTAGGAAVPGIGPTTAAAGGEEAAAGAAVAAAAPQPAATAAAEAVAAAATPETAGAAGPPAAGTAEQAPSLHLPEVDAADMVAAPQGHHPHHSLDEDFQLALRLQQEEEEQHSREMARQRELRQQQQQQQTPQVIRPQHPQQQQQAPQQQVTRPARPAGAMPGYSAAQALQVADTGAAQHAQRAGSADARTALAARQQAGQGESRPRSRSRLADKDCAIM